MSKKIRCGAKINKRKSKERNAQSIVNDTKIISNELGDLGVILFGHKGVAEQLKERLGFSVYQSMKEKTNILNSYNMSRPCDKLVNILINSPSSAINLRKIIRKSTLGEDEVFDDVVHADLNFVETTVVHFLNLINSPKNPMQHSSLERTAASFTIVIIINNLFVSNNDIIDLAWFEKEISTTGGRKWDGVAFATKDKRTTPLLLEFSGEINFNSTAKKEKGDEYKMVSNIIKVLKYNEVINAVTNYPVIQHYIRFFDRKIHFESICLFEDGTFVKRRYLTLVCPSTCNELIEFVKKVPLLFQWKHTIVEWTKKTTASDSDDDY